jgi:hypothetical protein
MLWIGTAIVGAVAGILTLFWILQRISDHTYRPSPGEIKEILQASLEGRLAWKALDEFSCVRIAYDPRLDRLRARYNAILDDPASFLGEATESNATPFSQQGAARVRELVNELDGP